MLYSLHQAYCLREKPKAQKVINSLRWIRYVVSNITVEPLFLLFAMCIGFYAIASSTLYIQKVCKVNLKYSEEICNNIQNHTEEQVKVQQHVSTLRAYNDVIQAIPPCVFVLFAGPWSDKYGRRPLMISAVFGYALSNLIFFLNAYYFYELKAEYLLLEAIQDMTGGSTVFFMASYSYLSDISDPKSRTTRFAFMDGLFPIGFYIGNSLAGIVAKYYGVLVNFSLGMLFALLAVSYIIFFLKDSSVIRDQRLLREIEEEIQDLELHKKFEEAEKVLRDFNEKKEKEAAKKKAGTSFKQLINIKNLKEGFANVFCKKRDHGGRLLLILIIAAFELEMLSMKGKWSSSYLYLRKQLKFDEVSFSRLITISGLINLVGQYLVVPLLSKKFKWSDSAIALTDAVTAVINLLFFAFAVSEWMLYVGGLIAILDSTTTTMLRSMISKMVHANEVGSVFSIVGTFQAFIPFIAGPLYGFLYKETVATFPAAFIFVVIGLKTIVFFDVLIVHLKSRKVQKIKRDLELQAQKIDEQSNLLAKEKTAGNSSDGAKSNLDTPSPPYVTPSSPPPPNGLST